MKSDKLLTLLGFASKAGRLSFGAAKSEEALKSGKSSLVVSACDISAKSRKEMEFSAKKYSVGFIVLKESDITAVSRAVGRQCGILSVNDSGFADALLKAYDEGGNANDK